MKTEFLSSEQTKFYELKPGDCFKLKNMDGFLIKTDHENEAVWLEDGATGKFSENKTVIPLPNAKIVNK